MKRVTRQVFLRIEFVVGDAKLCRYKTSKLEVTVSISVCVRKRNGGNACISLRGVLNELPTPQVHAAPTLTPRSAAIGQCPVAPFVSGSLVQRIPFVFLPLKEQIINPSAEISFAEKTHCGFGGSAPNEQSDRPLGIVVSAPGYKSRGTGFGSQLVPISQRSPEFD
uniref:Uncharacterized protein n=1 Tax=Timema douglasi TaxID=61478 RepID=A0A7R8VDI0_TIMDO|nr:unnamed protein product [Timema douglasi]